MSGRQPCMIKSLDPQRRSKRQYRACICLSLMHHLIAPASLRRNTRHQLSRKKRVRLVNSDSLVRFQSRASDDLPYLTCNFIILLDSPLFPFGCTPSYCFCSHSPYLIRLSNSIIVNSFTSGAHLRKLNFIIPNPLFELRG